MQEFQKTILIAALIIFIVFMLLVSSMLKNAKDESIFPPEVPTCPDYWENITDKPGNKGICRKTLAGAPGKKGACEQDMDFSVAPYNGANGRKEKCKWAKNCEIEWDGITNVGLC